MDGPVDKALVQIDQTSNRDAEDAIGLVVAPDLVGHEGTRLFELVLGENVGGGHGCSPD